MSPSQDSIGLSLRQSPTCTQWTMARCTTRESDEVKKITIHRVPWPLLHWTMPPRMPLYTLILATRWWTWIWAVDTRPWAIWSSLRLPTRLPTRLPPSVPTETSGSSSNLWMGMPMLWPCSICEMPLSGVHDRSLVLPTGLLLLLRGLWRVSTASSVTRIWPRTTSIITTTTRAFRVRPLCVDGAPSRVFTGRICIVWGAIRMVVRCGAGLSGASDGFLQRYSAISSVRCLEQCCWLCRGTSVPCFVGSMFRRFQLCSVPGFPRSQCATVKELGWLNDLVIAICFGRWGRVYGVVANTFVKTHQESRQSETCFPFEEVVWDLSGKGKMCTTCSILIYLLLTRYWGGLVGITRKGARSYTVVCWIASTSTGTVSGRMTRLSYEHLLYPFTSLRLDVHSSFPCPYPFTTRTRHCARDMVWELKQLMSLEIEVRSKANNTYLQVRVR